VFPQRPKHPVAPSSICFILLLHQFYSSGYDLLSVVSMTIFCLLDPIVIF
jgi:hypothetical protein